MTHAHGDHISALDQLKQAYPDAKVAYHELEAPYVTGGAQYSDLQGEHAAFNLLKKAIPPINSTLLPPNEGMCSKENQVM